VFPVTGDETGTWLSGRLLAGQGRGLAIDPIARRYRHTAQRCNLPHGVMPANRRADSYAATLAILLATIALNTVA